MDPKNSSIDLKRYKYSNLPPYIKHMAEHGAICIIPLKGGSKKPIGAVEWTKHIGLKRQYPLNKLKRKRGNFALIMGDPLQWGTGYLTILDIDDKRGPGGLYQIFKDIDTLQVKTPSKGYHIYFMSEKQVTDKNYIGRLFNLDIELRGNPGNLTTLPPSFIIDRDKEKKIITGSHEVIKERSESKGFIDIPDVEEFVKTRLENAGYSPNENIKPISPNKTYITPSVDGRWERSLNAGEKKCIITLLKPFYKEGNRQNICLWLSGWMQKAEINFQSSIKVIELLSKDDTNSEKKNV